MSESRRNVEATDSKESLLDSIWQSVEDRLSTKEGRDAALDELDDISPRISNLARKARKVYNGIRTVQKSTNVRIVSSGATESQAPNVQITLDTAKFDESRRRILSVARELRELTDLAIEEARHAQATLFRPGEVVVDPTWPIITSGAFCDLLCGRHSVYGRVAIKRLRSDMTSSATRSPPAFLGEVRVWQKLSHPNLLPFLGILIEDAHISLLSPYVDNGPVPEYLQQHPDTDRAAFVAQLASALAYLHNKGVVHGDLKGSNMLVSDDIEVLLCDFGLAKTVDTTTASALAGHGSLQWQAPELFDGKGRTYETDVFAFGMVIYQVLSGKVPFEHHTSPAAITRAIFIDKERPPQEPALSPNGTPYEYLWYVASACWAEAPEDRPTMENVLPWFV